MSIAAEKSEPGPGKLVALGRFVVLSAIWVAIYLWMYTYLYNYPRWWDIAIAVVIAPLSCFLFLRGIIPSCRVTAASASSLALTVAFVVFHPNENLSPDAITLLTGVGVLAGLQSVLLVATLPAKQSLVHHVWLVLVCTVWWSSWGIAIAGNYHHTEVDSLSLTCASNLKRVGVALLKYEEQQDIPASGVRDLVATELIDVDTSRCPIGGEYTITLSKTGSQDHIVSVCKNHRRQKIVLNQDTSITIEKASD